MTHLLASPAAPQLALPAVRPVTVARLDTARRIAASIVRVHGPVYLPIFERLQAEYQARMTTEALIEELTTTP